MKKRKKKPTMADMANRHELYQASVQSTEFEIEFYEDRFRELRGKRRKPKAMREDFCGTALFAADWCKSHARRQAFAVDLCADTLQWGADNIIKPAGLSVSRRVTLLNQNVLSVKTEKVDFICAMNFSYCIFKSRDLLRKYFKNALRGLKSDGLFFLDLMGGDANYRS